MNAGDLDLKDQVALITGGAGAIGRAISKGLVEVGAKVVLVDINESRLKGFEQELIAKHGPGCALSVVADVRDSQQVRGAFELALKEFGRLDILVNNAAVTQIKAVDVLSEDDIDIMIDSWGTDDPLCDIGPMPWGDATVDVEDLIVLVEHIVEARATTDVVE